jgi:hypothetical protein
VRLPRSALLFLCASLTALAYYFVLFANLGNYYYHRGTYVGKVAADAVVVLAAFSCIEVLRTERRIALRALAGALAAPLVLVMLLVLWYGVRRYVAA